MRDHVKSLKFKDETVGKIVAEAVGWIGTPYKYAGQSKSGTDCSGFILEVFKTTTGVKIPRNSAAQHLWCLPAHRDSLQPGDLIFFATGGDPNRVSHVGLYIGGDEMIHASSSSGVIVSQLQLPYYVKRYHSAGRPPMLATANTLIEIPETPPAPPVLETLDLDQMIDAVVDSVFLDFFN